MCRQESVAEFQHLCVFVSSLCRCISCLLSKSTHVQVSDEDEYKLVVQALRLNTLSKLTFADSQRFDALVRDVFPNVPFKGIC